MHKNRDETSLELSRTVNVPWGYLQNQNYLKDRTSFFMTVRQTAFCEINFFFKNEENQLKLHFKKHLT